MPPFLGVRESTYSFLTVDLQISDRSPLPLVKPHRTNPRPVEGRANRPKRTASGAVRKSAPFTGHPPMDIERINAIGAKIADLTERTAALRGYL